ncbi:MAG: hypothetical protein O7F71_21905 [Gammaproteobacteria bacterium]|nr:hypothetical protein [Gammaproteobacteria bacterium]
MKQTLLMFVLLAVAVPAHSAQDMEMWGCAPLGERRTVLFIVDRGSRSYVKVGGQRAPARVAVEDGGKRWSWGGNSILLLENSRADYYESGEVKGRFQCKRVNR